MSSKEKPKNFRAKSLEEIDSMTEEEVLSASISGKSKARVQERIDKGESQVEAKRAVIKANFISATSGKDKPKKRSRSEDSTPQRPHSKKPRGVAGTKTTSGQQPKSYKEAASCEKVAIVLEGYPEAQMSTERIEQVQAAVTEAYEGIPDEGPQVRFEKCNHRPGHFLVTCADKTSAEWLANVTPTLKP
jgi:hypothetical protein